jgi:hypothetical protein
MAALAAQAIRIVVYQVRAVPKESSSRRMVEI